MNLKRWQLVAFLTAGLLMPVSFVAQRMSIGKFADLAFLITVYLTVVSSLIITIARYRREQHDFLPVWRRVGYSTGLTLLTLFCFLPMATWPIALSGTEVPEFRAVVVGLLVVNAAAATMVWFGKGLQRLGLTLVSFWVLFLWMFPLALRG